MLQSRSTNAQIYNKKVHSGAIKTLQYNPHPKFSNYLATGGAKGEVFIVDLSNLEGDPIRLGSTAARADDIDCLDWNKKVPNILVTGSSGGFVTVWDLKTRKESLTLNNFGRKPVSAVAWDPAKPTRLITAVPLEQEPVILVWDLRNSNAPEKVLRGHDSGVLSLAWCPQDSDLLLSCGKDNRTILWNPQTGEAYGDYPVVTNWTFQTRWNPKNPNIFATASFDGKLQIQSLQNANPSTNTQQEQTQAEGEDFFSKAQSAAPASSFSLSKAPKWLERPCSVSFGFGGRLVAVRLAEPGKSRSSKIVVTKFEVDSDVGAATNTFEEALASGNLQELCEIRAQNAQTDEEKSDWSVMRTLLASKPREELVKYLGYDDTTAIADDLAKLGVEDKREADEDEKPKTNGVAKGHRRFESVFATDADGDFLSQLAATQGTRTNNPFSIHSEAESEPDRTITKLIMLGQFEKALDITLKENKMADAFMLAICGGEKCIKKAQEAYFARKSDGPNYLRLLASVVGKNLWDTVHNAGLSDWKGIMATLCTFADENEFPDLCEALGDRLEEQVSTSPSARKDAAFCYLAGSKLEKVVQIWVQELKEHEEDGAKIDADSSAFSVHAKALQDLIEKVTIFRSVVKFQDNELDKKADYKLAILYSKYLEYADILAGHGQLEAAQRYLDLLPVQYPEADVARTRIRQATRKPTVNSNTTTAAATSRQKPLPAAGYQAQSAAFPPTPSTTSPFATQTPAPAQASTYNPPNAVGPSSYTPSNPATQPSLYGTGSASQGPYSAQNQFQSQQAQRPANPYAPQGGQQGYQLIPQMSAAIPPPPQQFGMPQQNQFGPPPRQFSSSPAVPPPSQAKNMTNWNDLPEGFTKTPTPRRGTPSVPGQAPQPTNQFIGAPSPPQTAGTPFGARPGKTAPPPPPKAGEVQRVQSPQSVGAQIQRPTSTALNAYAPNQQQSAPLAPPTQPPVQRITSPFAPPPTGVTQPNRYAPAPGAPPSQPQGPAPTRQVAPPPTQPSFHNARVPSNPYAPTSPQVPSTGRENPYAAIPPPQALMASPLSPASSQQPSQFMAAAPLQQGTVAPPPPASTTTPRPGSSSSAAASRSTPAARRYRK